jgi:putative transposase
VHRRRRGRYGRRSASTATAPDRVERDFTATGPNQLWVVDVTYLRSWEGFVSLAVVVDAFRRKVVGGAMADHLRTELVLDAVGMAITARKPPVATAGRPSPEARP